MSWEPITLRKLQARINEIVADAERRGDPDGRLDLPVYVEMNRGNRKATHWYPVHYAASGLTGVGGHLMNTLITHESEIRTIKNVADAAPRMIMLRDDGEVWEIAPGLDTDENSVIVRRADPLWDRPAIDAGVTHLLSSYGDIKAHEIRQVERIGNSNLWREKI